jgi:hypothetical protein
MGWHDWFRSTPSQDSLARDLLRLASQHGSTDWTYDPGRCVLRPTQGGGQIDVAGIHREYITTRSQQRPTLLEKYLPLLVDTECGVPHAWEFAANGIHVAVRSRYTDMLHEIECRRTGKPFSASVRWTWIGDIDILLLYEFGIDMPVVTEDAAGRWGQSRDVLWHRALENLRALPLPNWEDLNDGVLRLFSECAHEETFPLVDKVMRSLPFNGTPVIAIPNPGVLLAADSNDPAALRNLIGRARDSLEKADWPLSGALLALTPSGWERFVPPLALVRHCAALEEITLCGIYAKQKAALEKNFMACGEDVTVATLSLQARQDNPELLNSLCTWTEGTPALLPRTDLIVFVPTPGEPESPNLIARWADVERICGHRLARTQEDPVRYFVNTFPDAGEQQELAAAVI